MASIDKDIEFFLEEDQKLMDKQKSFLPAGEVIPKSSASGTYMRFDKEKENKFRILSHAITGWELWVSGKPLRQKQLPFTPDQMAQADPDTFSPEGKLKTPQYFWAFVVYNYQSENVEILEIKQKTIMEGIKNCMGDEDYGNDVTKYDFVVKMNEDQKGYSVRPKPPKDIDENITELYKEMEINLDALYSGEDPFNSK